MVRWPIEWGQALQEFLSREGLRAGLTAVPGMRGSRMAAGQRPIGAMHRGWWTLMEAPNGYLPVAS
jgi:hypothetical protein